MGVPSLYKYLSERWPMINQTINAGLKPELDCLYLDMNGIVHNATHANGGQDTTVSEDQMFLQIFQYIEQLFELAQPKKLLYMALDGVAPRAKMNQQRQRRFRSGQALQAKLDNALLLQQQGLESDVKIDDLLGAFDSNCITPGTEFMDRLSAHIQYYVRRKITEDKRWQGIQVIFSGSDSIGEGEHKIMAYIRAQRMQPDYNPNLRHCVYGLDADLIMLSLVSHEHNTVLLREEVVFGDQGDKFKNRQQLLKPGQFQLLHIGLLREYIHYDLNFAHKASWYDLERLIDDIVLLCYLAGNDFLPSVPTIRIGLGSLDALFTSYKQCILKLGGYITCNGTINIERLIEYFKFLAQHEQDLLNIVNEDLQKIAQMQAEKMGLSGDDTSNPTSSFTSPKSITSTPSNTDSNDKFISQVNIREVIQPLTSTIDVDALFNDPTLITQNAEGETTLNDEKLDQAVKQQTDAFFATLENQIDMDGLTAGFNEMNIDDADIDPTTGLSKRPNENDSFDELLKKGYYWDSDAEEFVALDGDITFENYYHRRLPDVARQGKAGVEKLCLDYIEGLYWVYKYYYQCVPSWKWQFQYYHAPFIRDLANVDASKCKFRFDIGEPFTPLQQLMAVLPPQSAGLLPSSLRPLMLLEDSPIRDFYPKTFDVDMEGKRWDHEGVAKIPFIEEVSLIGAMESQVKNLTMAAHQANRKTNPDINPECELSLNELRRNINSKGDLLFQYDPTRLNTPYSLKQGYTQVLRLAKLVPESEVALYEGNPPACNQLYFSDLRSCPVSCTLYKQATISNNPTHLFTKYGPYQVQGKDEPNQQYNELMTKVVDNPYVLTQYDGDANYRNYQEALENDKKYLEGKILQEATRFVPLRLIMSQQPLPGFPTLKVIMESYVPPSMPNFKPINTGIPHRFEEHVSNPQQWQRRKKGRRRFADDDDAELNAFTEEEMDKIFNNYDEMAPKFIFGKPPITCFGRRSMRSSLLLSFRHDPHTHMYKYKYLEPAQRDDGLNPREYDEVAQRARAAQYGHAEFSNLENIVNRFAPGRIVWCDFPFLRPGRIEWITNGDYVIVPSNYRSSAQPVKVATNFQVIPATTYHRKLYQSESGPMFARYKHMLGIDIDQQLQGNIMVCIAPLVEMRMTQSGELQPHFDTQYVPRKSATSSNQNGIHAQHGNLNALPGLLFAIPHLLWAAPPTIPDQRWKLTAKLPTREQFKAGTQVIGLTQDTYGYIGVVKDFTSRAQASQNAGKPAQDDQIAVEWQQIPPPVPLEFEYKPNIFLQVASCTKYRYFNAPEVARTLKITGRTLFRITGTMFFKLGYKVYNFGLQLHSAKQSLLLPDYCRYNNRWLAADGNTNQRDIKAHERSIGDSGDRWEYSQLAVLLIKKYQIAYPEIFEYLDAAQQVPADGTIDVNQLFRHAWMQKQQQYPEYEPPYNPMGIPVQFSQDFINQNKRWLEALGLQNAVMVSATSKQISAASVSSLESLVVGAHSQDNDGEVSIRANATPGKPPQLLTFKVADLKDILNPVPFTPDNHILHNESRQLNDDPATQNPEKITKAFAPAQLLLPSSLFAYSPLLGLDKKDLVMQQQSRSKQQFFKLCDRVMICRTDCRVPLGATGTIIGLHSQFLPLSSQQAQSEEFALNVQGGEDLYLELLLDQPCMVATTLRGKCKTPMGAIVQATQVLNLSQPVWMLKQEAETLEHVKVNQAKPPRQQQQQPPPQQQGNQRPQIQRPPQQQQQQQGRPPQNHQQQQQQNRQPQNYQQQGRQQQQNRQQPVPQQHGPPIKVFVPQPGAAPIVMPIQGQQLSPGAPRVLPPPSFVPSPPPPHGFVPPPPPPPPGFIPPPPPQQQHNNNVPQPFQPNPQYQQQQRNGPQNPQYNHQQQRNGPYNNNQQQQQRNGPYNNNQQQQPQQQQRNGPYNNNQQRINNGQQNNNPGQQPRQRNQQQQQQQQTVPQQQPQNVAPKVIIKPSVKQPAPVPVVPPTITPATAPQAQKSEKKQQPEESAIIQLDDLFSQFE